MRLDLSKWVKSQSSPNSSIPQKIKDFHQKNHEISVFMDSAGFLCILCVFVESNPPNRTNCSFFPPHFPVFVVFQKRFRYISFFTYCAFGREKPGLAVPAPVREIFFTKRYPQGAPSSIRRRSSGRRCGRWWPPECPDSTRQRHRRCPSTSSSREGARPQTADRGPARG